MPARGSGLQLQMARRSSSRFPASRTSSGWARTAYFSVCAKSGTAHYLDIWDADHFDGFTDMQGVRLDDCRAWFSGDGYTTWGSGQTKTGRVNCYFTAPVAGDYLCTAALQSYPTGSAAQVECLIDNFSFGPLPFPRDDLPAAPVQPVRRRPPLPHPADVRIVLSPQSHRLEGMSRCPSTSRKHPERDVIDEGRARELSLARVRTLWVAGNDELARLAGAEPEAKPIVIHDLAGPPLFYDFPLQDEQGSAGVVRAAASSSVGTPLVAAELGPRSWEADVATRKAREAVRKEHKDAKVTGSRLVCYCYPKIGVEVTFDLPRRGSRRAIIDVSDGLPVVNLGADEREGARRTLTTRR